MLNEKNMNCTEKINGTEMWNELKFEKNEWFEMKWTIRKSEMKWIEIGNKNECNLK